ncbi:TIGR03749 family integrating conjugative element protein [Serratia sp. 1D1416]|uniref:TIGR03749 family integrating conjugative element protein n=1 Tax=Serratia sp. 1D1416 TaxID=2447890 RepID=UPI001013CC7E|nr:TIGR03749 family integrating conjugative element protein [Serratia sp. 1D1416]
MNRYVLILLTGLCLATTAHAVELLHWDRMPLGIPLYVDQERVAFIDRNVRIGVPPEVTGKLRVQSAGGAVYLRASTPLPPTRLQLQDVESGEIILLDIAAEAAKEGQAALEPVRIINGEGPETRYGGTAQTPRLLENSPAQTTTQPETPVPVVLTRYAAQNLYVPLRTVEPVTGIGRVNLHRGLALDTLLSTLPVRARALAAWRLEDFQVAAIQLTNTSARWIELDPRALQGNFVAATFQHPDLGPVGAPTDTTVLYLVTRNRGLADVLLPTLSTVDATVNLPATAAEPAKGGASDAK